MPQSKKRNGAKAHRKKVEQRNKTVKSEYERAAKAAWEKFESWKQQQGNQDNKGFPTITSEQN